MFYVLVKTGFGDFNSRAHVERDLQTGGEVVDTAHFNSRAHVERDAQK